MSDYETIIKRIDHIESKLKVEVSNGKTKTKYINEVVEQIWSDIEPLRDLNKVHHINKKYKLYWLFGAILFIMVGGTLKELITNLIK